MRKNWKVLCVLLLLLLAGFYYFRVYSPAPTTHPITVEESDPYVQFDMEVLDLIKTNYWKQSTTSDFVQLFQLSLQKAKNSPTLPIVETPDRSGIAKMLALGFKTATSSEAKKQLARDVLIVALYNLPPQGRNGLLTSKEETKLRESVANIDKSKDLYQNLGLAKGADQATIDKAYKEKEATLSKTNTPEAKVELEKLAYAHKVLTDTTSKTAYDQAQIEPTVFKHIMGDTLYMYMSQISPNTLGEFARAVDSSSTTPKLSSMIIDLRGNIGGDLTFPQYFLGLFIGQNQYAFDLFHQGDYQVLRTVTPRFPELDRFKEIAILADGMTQSTAELTTAIFKRLHLARVVGTKTHGWGSVENTYPITTVIDPTEKYSLLLVNSLTLGDDNQPIESNGVVPDVDTSSANWKSKLSNYFKSSAFITVLQKVASGVPLK
jgi:C-terminal processing protease CtpA/Prc